MKQTFLNLPDSKRELIIRSCIEEFGAFGYEQGSTDRIIKSAGISKGGHYEYINDFIMKMSSEANVKTVWREYLKEWNLILDIFRNGIYKR